MFITKNLAKIRSSGGQMIISLTCRGNKLKTTHITGCSSPLDSPLHSARFKDAAETLNPKNGPIITSASDERTEQLVGIDDLIQTPSSTVTRSSPDIPTTGPLKTHAHRQQYNHTHHHNNHHPTNRTDDETHQDDLIVSQQIKQINDPMESEIINIKPTLLDAFNSSATLRTHDHHHHHHHHHTQPQNQTGVLADSIDSMPTHHEHHHSHHVHHRSSGSGVAFKDTQLEQQLASEASEKDFIIIKPIIMAEALPHSAASARTTDSHRQHLTHTLSHLHINHHNLNNPSADEIPSPVNVAQDHFQSTLGHFTNLLNSASRITNAIINPAPMQADNKPMSKPMDEPQPPKPPSNEAEKEDVTTTESPMADGASNTSAKARTNAQHRQHNNHHHHRNNHHNAPAHSHPQTRPTNTVGPLQQDPVSSESINTPSVTIPPLTSADIATNSKSTEHTVGVQTNMQGEDAINADLMRSEQDANALNALGDKENELVNDEMIVMNVSALETSTRRHIEGLPSADEDYDIGYEGSGVGDDDKINPMVIKTLVG